MMAPSKGILIVVASLTGGGAERVAAVWADGLAESGHRVTVLTDLSRPATFMPSHRVRLVSLGLTARPAGRGLRFASWAVASRFRAAMALWRILRDERIDVIVDVGHQYGAEVLAIGRLKGVKLLQTDHNACTRPSDMPLSLRDRWR
ncbi:MAG: glycosyltransferase, partial [Muribaculaceae bacterium]|nr:glycosyltransferase [Muribaculaceae bacterium]